MEATEPSRSSWLAAKHRLHTFDPFERVEKALCENKLAHFVRQAWQIVEPQTHYLHNWHIDLICEHLEAVMLGQERRLLFNMPPRYMKSSIISVMWPVWGWAHDPGSRWMFASYADELSTYHSLQRRSIIQSEWYRRYWPIAADLTSDQNVKTQYQNSSRGHMIATSMKGGGTGLGGNFIIIDDPHKTKETEGSADVKAAVENFKSTFANRHDDKQKGVTVIVMQRINQQDLSGYVLELGGYTHVKLEAEAEEHRTIIFPMSGRVFEREEGDLLWPAREGPKEILEHKKRGSYYFAAQYQQRPVPLGGGIIKRFWWQRYTVDPIALKPLTPLTYIVQSWDTAAKTGTLNDYSVCTTWGVTPAPIRLLLLHRWRERVEYPDLKRAMRELAKQFKANLILIEDSSAGQAVVQDLRREGGLPVVPIGVHKDKVTNAIAASGMIEAGMAQLPEHAEWDVEEYLTLMSYFPNAVYHDDDVDSTTMFLNYIREHQFIISTVWDREAAEMDSRLKQKCANPACLKPMVPGEPIYQARGLEFCSTLCAM